MRREDIIWGEDDWESLFAEYGQGKDDLKSFLWGLAICVVGWGIVGLCAWWAW